MPLLGTRGVASARGFGFGAAAAQTASFISNINSTTYDVRAQTSAVDSSGNMYVGFGNTSNNTLPTVVKYNTAGAVVFQKQIAVSGVTLQNVCAVTVNNADNLFVAVRDNNSSDSVIIVRMTTAGAVVNAYRASGTINAFNPSIAAFGSTLVIAGRDASTSGMCVFAYDTSSNTISWARRWSTGSGSIYMDPVAIAESPNYYYVFGYTSTPNPFIFQFSKGGNLNWGRITSPNGFTGAGVADSSDNSYISIPSSNGATTIIKYDPSYNPLGAASPNTSKQINVRRFAKDVNGNMYLCGQANVGANQVTSGYMAKMTTALVVSQERSVAITNRPTTQNIIYNTGVVTNGNLFASGYASDGAVTYSNYMSSISVPLDGTKTGNYTVNRYPSETYTFAYQTYTETNGWAVFSGSTTGSFGSQNSDPSTSVTSVTASVSDVSLVVNTTLM
jgi:hypothetical protein